MIQEVEVAEDHLIQDLEVEDHLILDLMTMREIELIVQLRMCVVEKTAGWTLACLRSREASMVQRSNGEVGSAVLYHGWHQLTRCSKRHFENPSRDPQ